MVRFGGNTNWGVRSRAKFRTFCPHTVRPNRATTPLLTLKQGSCFHVSPARFISKGQTTLRSHLRMAKPYDSGSSSSEGTPSNGSIASEEEVRNGAEANLEEEIDEEELEAVARTAGPEDDEAKDDSGEEDAREDEDDGDEYGEEVRFGCLWIGATVMFPITMDKCI